MPAQPDRVTVVIATRNRRPELLRTLGRLRDLPERPPVIVVDNASADDSPAAVRDRFPAVTLRVLPRNAGAAARNVGVALAATPYVAFSDDDSWWEPGALARAATALDADSRLGLVAARTLTGPAREPDPVNALMARSPLRDGGTAEVLGFLACACVVRKEAFLRAGGFSQLLFFIGEERLLSYDLPPRAGPGATTRTWLRCTSHPRPGRARICDVRPNAATWCSPRGCAGPHRWRWPRRCAWPGTPPAIPMTVPRWRPRPGNCPRRCGPGASFPRRSSGKYRRWPRPRAACGEPAPIRGRTA